MSNGKGHDTTDVIRRRTFLLGEVANKLGAGDVGGRHDVKEEGFDVVVERFVIEKHLGEETEILTVDLQHDVSTVVERDAERLTLFLRPSTSKTDTFPSR